MCIITKTKEQLTQIVAISTEGCSHYKCVM